MSQENNTKEAAFKMWKEGKSLIEIQEAICSSSKTLPSRITEWVRDWERGQQHTWTPNLD
jgi:hypothetical protein